MRLFGVVAGLLLFALLGPLACSKDETNTSDVSTAVSNSESSKTELCSGINDLQNAIKQVDNLSSSSTVDDAKKVQSDVKNAVEDVKSAAESSAAARVSAIETAQSALTTAINNISGDQTLGSIVTVLKTQAANISSALDGLKSDVKCS